MGYIRSGTAPLYAALVFFVIFFANVSMGAAGAGVFLGDLAEMLTLFAAALCFVVGVLGREAAATTRSEREDSE